MLTLNVIKARIRRQKIAEMAADSFLSPESIRDKISYLKNVNDTQFLFGIYDTPKKWTVLSVTKLFGCYNGEPFEFVMSLECEKIDDFIHEQNKKDFINIVLKDGRTIWMKSVGLSCAIRNVMEMLRVLSSDIVLDE